MCDKVPAIDQIPRYCSCISGAQGGRSTHGPHFESLDKVARTGHFARSSNRVGRIHTCCYADALDRSVNVEVYLRVWDGGSGRGWKASAATC